MCAVKKTELTPVEDRLVGQRTGDRFHFVSFSVGERSLALPLGQVERILRMVAPTPLPEEPDWVMGLIRLGPETLPVLDLGVVLGLPPRAADPDQRLLIAPLKDLRLALMVDHVADVIEVSAAELGPKPKPLAQSGQLAGVINLGGEIILLLSGEGLLPAKDQKRLLELLAEQEKGQSE